MWLHVVLLNESMQKLLMSLVIMLHCTSAKIIKIIVCGNV